MTKSKYTKKKHNLRVRKHTKKRYIRQYGSGKEEAEILSEIEALLTKDRDIK